MTAGKVDTTRMRYFELEAVPNGMVHEIGAAVVLVTEPMTTGAVNKPSASDISALNTLPTLAGPPEIVNWTKKDCPEQNGPPLMFLVVMDVNANALTLSIETKKRSKAFFMELKAVYELQITKWKIRLQGISVNRWISTVESPDPAIPEIAGMGIFAIKQSFI